MESCLDRAIISKELSKYVYKLLIDKNLQYTAFNPTKIKPIFPDHYGLFLIFKNIPLKSGASWGKKSTKWNTRKEGSWKTYYESTAFNDKLEKIAVEESDDANKMMKEIDKELENVKLRSFGKAKVSKKIKANKEILKLQEEKRFIIDNDDDGKFELIKNIDKQINEELLKEQRKVFEEELETLKNIKANKGKSAAIFETKQKIVGRKKSGQEATVIINPENGKEVNRPKEIKRVCLEYCSKLLTNRSPKEDFEDDMKMKKEVHLARMEEEVDDDIEEMTDSMFKRSWDSLRSKTGNKYKFLFRAGPSLKKAIKKLCQTTWRTERCPRSWHSSTSYSWIKLLVPRNWTRSVIFTLNRRCPNYLDTLWLRQQKTI